VLVGVSGVARPAAAELILTGSGSKVGISTEGWPPERKAQYEVFKGKCSKCHALARPISAIKTGQAPISGLPFNEAFAKKYVVRMMRKPNSGVARDDAKEIVDLITYLMTLDKP
jgi:hypothetical protein